MYIIPKPLLFAFLAVSALAQNQRTTGTIMVWAAPSGVCLAKSPMEYYSAGNQLWGCVLPTITSLTGTWTQITGGGGGGATIPATTNIIKGDGAGNGADSGYVAQNATTSLTGFLTATDWNTFNNKVSATCTSTCVTAASALTVNLPMFGDGLQASKVGTRSGNTTEVATVTGSLTSGDCLASDASGNLVDAGVSCTGGGGGGGGGIGSNIVTGNWTTLGSPTRTDNTSSITILSGTSATNRIEGVSHAVSAGDFSVTITLYAALPTGATGPPAILVGFTDGTKTEGSGVDASSTPFLAGQNLSDTALSGGTTAAANGPIAASLHAPTAGIIFAKITRVGTALSGYLSYDGGITYTQIFNDTAPFLTASAICVYVQTRGSVNVETFTLISSSLP